MTVISMRERTDATVRPAGDKVRIRVRGLIKRYGNFEVFSGIDFEVGEREIVAIVGPSGCGKTTLLRCIDGLLPVDAGEIFVAGQRVLEPIAGMAMVFQHFGLFPWKTVFDNVAYGLRMARASRADIARQVPYFINLVGLAGFSRPTPIRCRRHAAALRARSRAGDRTRRADDGRAVCRSGCPDPRNPAIRVLRIWEQRPTTMVFVTHSIEEAVLMGDRVFVLKGRPSSIQETIAIDLPRPRTRETLREPRFAELREQVWSTLMSEAKQAEFHLEP